ncbi:hypothetical protein [Anthocerotibacter panamensis]|uniref:hypothetical protein n=1 Tax=Anthocerotibacter panamensis TaxID=2857077 RepID=UPI001C405A8F|nr:hypothetical protein [Anthocerotibacter panamensis]
MRRLIVSLLLSAWYTLPAHAFALGQTETEILARYGQPTRQEERPTFKRLVYVRSFGQVVVLLGPDGKTEAILQLDSNYGRDYPQVGQFLGQQQPSLSLTDKAKTRSIELFQQLSERGFEAWIYKRRTPREILVFGDLLAVPYRRDEARELLLEYGQHLLDDPKIQKLLEPAYKVEGT